MYFSVKKADYVQGYQIKLTFEDGSAGIVDLKEYPEKGEVFKNFADIEYFKKFKIHFGTLSWGNGETDIAPETLYIKATGKPIVLEEELEFEKV